MSTHTLIQAEALAGRLGDSRLRIFDCRFDLARPDSGRERYLEGLRFLLDVNGQRLASGLSSERATLPRLGEVVVPVTTTTSLLDLVNQIVAFGQQPQPRFEYDLRGKIYLSGLWGSLPFQRKGSHEDLVPRSRAPKQKGGEVTK